MQWRSQSPPDEWKILPEVFMCWWEGGSLLNASQCDESLQVNVKACSVVGYQMVYYQLGLRAGLCSHGEHSSQ